MGRREGREVGKRCNWRGDRSEEERYKFYSQHKVPEKRKAFFRVFVSHLVGEIRTAIDDCCCV